MSRLFDDWTWLMAYLNILAVISSHSEIISERCRSNQKQRAQDVPVHPLTDLSLSPMGRTCSDARHLSCTPDDDARVSPDCVKHQHYQMDERDMRGAQTHHLIRRSTVAVAVAVVVNSRVKPAQKHRRHVTSPVAILTQDKYRHYQCRLKHILVEIRQVIVEKIALWLMESVPEAN